VPNSVHLNTFPKLLSPNLADPPSSAPEGIDILIGSDYYWNFVGDEVNRIEGGPTVVKSTLGWLLSGPTMTSDPPTVSGTHLAVCQQSVSLE